jgi:hypothetical protein
MRSLDIGLKMLIISFDGPHASESLHAEDDPILELSLIVLFVVVHH